jgi:hypothetical protein
MIKHVEAGSYLLRQFGAHVLSKHGILPSNSLKDLQPSVLFTLLSSKKSARVRYKPISLVQPSKQGCRSRCSLSLGGGFVVCEERQFSATGPQVKGPGGDVLSMFRSLGLLEETQALCLIPAHGLPLPPCLG